MPFTRKFKREGEPNTFWVAVQIAIIIIIVGYLTYKVVWGGLL